MQVKEEEDSLLNLKKSKDFSNFCKKPKYDVTNRKKRKLIKEIEDSIEFHLLENEQKRKSGRRKQQKKGTDIHQYLLDLRVYSNEIICYYKNEKICTQIRFHTLGRWYIDLDHYLKTLTKKPGAFKGSIAFKQADENIRSLYFEHYKGSEKDFINLLNYMKLKNKNGIQQNI